MTINADLQSYTHHTQRERDGLKEFDIYNKFKIIGKPGDNTALTLVHTHIVNVCIELSKRTVSIARAWRVFKNYFYKEWCMTPGKPRELCEHIIDILVLLDQGIDHIVTGKRHLDSDHLHTPEFATHPINKKSYTKGYSGRSLEDIQDFCTRKKCLFWQLASEILKSQGSRENIKKYARGRMLDIFSPLSSFVGSISNHVNELRHDFRSFFCPDKHKYHAIKCRYNEEVSRITVGDLQRFKADSVGLLRVVPTSAPSNFNDNIWTTVFHYPRKEEQEIRRAINRSSTNKGVSQGGSTEFKKSRKTEKSKNAVSAVRGKENATCRKKRTTAVRNRIIQDSSDEEDNPGPYSKTHQTRKAARGCTLQDSSDEEDYPCGLEDVRDSKQACTSQKLTRKPLSIIDGQKVGNPAPTQLKQPKDKQTSTANVAHARDETPAAGSKASDEAVLRSRSRRSVGTCKDGPTMDRKCDTLRKRVSQLQLKCVLSLNRLQAIDDNEKHLIRDFQERIPDEYIGLNNCHYRALHAVSPEAAAEAYASEVKTNETAKIKSILTHHVSPDDGQVFRVQMEHWVGCSRTKARYTDENKVWGLRNFQVCVGVLEILEKSNKDLKLVTDIEYACHVSTKCISSKADTTEGVNAEATAPSTIISPEEYHLKVCLKMKRRKNVQAVRHHQFMTMNNAAMGVGMGIGGGDGSGNGGVGCMPSWMQCEHALKVDNATTSASNNVDNEETEQSKVVDVVEGDASRFHLPDQPKLKRQKRDLNKDLRDKSLDNEETKVVDGVEGDAFSATEQSRFHPPDQPKLKRRKRALSKDSRHKRFKAIQKKGGSRLVPNMSSINQTRKNDRTCLLEAISALLPSNEIKQAFCSELSSIMPRSGDTAITCANEALKPHRMLLKPVSKEYHQNGGAAFHLMKERQCKLVINIKLTNTKNQVMSHFISWDGKTLYDQPEMSIVNDTYDRHEKGSKKVFEKLYKKTDFRSWQITSIYRLESKC